MTNPIQPISPVLPVDSVSLSPAAGARKTDAPAASFSSLIEQSIARVDQFQRDTREKTTSLLNGEDREIHEVVLAAQRAELTFDYFLQVRNKVVQAYQEIMRMQM